jgi:hypothetical protein
VAQSEKQERGESDMKPWLKNLLTVLLVVGLIIAFLWLLYGLIDNPIGRWALVAGVMIVLLLLIGATGTEWGPFGALIDPQRGRYSLSQLQLVTWTVLVISAWLAIVTTRIVLQVPDQNGPLNVEIPQEMLVLLGISAGSLVSASAIKSNQASDGHLYVAGGREEAKWTDFWMGDQTGDHAYIDIGKFQMFWFTTAAVVAYGIQISSAITSAMPNPDLIKEGVDIIELARAGFNDLTSLPIPHPSLVGVLGVSHLGYLTNKLPERRPPKSTS